MTDSSPISPAILGAQLRKLDAEIFTRNRKVFILNESRDGLAFGTFFTGRVTFLAFAIFVFLAGAVGFLEGFLPFDFTFFAACFGFDAEGDFFFDRGERRALGI